MTWFKDIPHISDIKELYHGDELPMAGTAHDLENLQRHIDAGGDPWEHETVVNGVRALHGPVRLTGSRKPSALAQLKAFLLKDLRWTIGIAVVVVLGVAGIVIKPRWSAIAPPGPGETIVLSDRWQQYMARDRPG